MTHAACANTARGHCLALLLARRFRAIIELRFLLLPLGRLPEGLPGRRGREDRRRRLRRAGRLHGRRVLLGLVGSRSLRAPRRFRLLLAFPLAQAAPLSLVFAALLALVALTVAEPRAPVAPPLSLSSTLRAAKALSVRRRAEPAPTTLQEAQASAWSAPAATSPPSSPLNSGRFSARLWQAQGRFSLPNGLASESSCLLFSEALFSPVDCESQA